MSCNGNNKGEDSSGKVVVKRSELCDRLTQEAVELTTQAMEKFTVEQEIAMCIKKEMDKKCPGGGGPSGGCWQCIVGQSFGSYVTHENDAFVHMEKDATAILLFRK